MWEITGSGGLQLCCVLGTTQASRMADRWQVEVPKGVAGLPEPQCIMDTAVAQRLGLDLDGVAARRVSAGVSLGCIAGL